MESKDRQSIIEKVASRWKEGGIKNLEKFGSFEKYSPMFHYHISEPFNLDENFIFITELFGNKKNIDHYPMNFEGTRLQYQGNYDGLQRIVATGITRHNLLPSEQYVPGIGRMPVTLPSPSFQIIEPEKEDKNRFDESLLYLDYITRHLSPNSFNIDSQKDFFQSTFYI